MAVMASFAKETFVNRLDLNRISNHDAYGMTHHKLGEAVSIDQHYMR